MSAEQLAKVNIVKFQLG